MNDMVSIIIPTHKGYENLSRAVDSCLNQTYKNIEIFVVDDNGRGTEAQCKTQSVMEKYSELENVNYLIHEENKNGSAARNTGARASSGEFIAFLDDDDEYLPQNIENHIKKFEYLDESYGITYCAKNLIHGNGKEETIIPRYEGDLLYDFMCGKIRMGSSFIMVKRGVYDEVAGFDESFRRHQDWEFIVRILVRYKAGAVKDVGLNKYLLSRNKAKNPEQFEKNRLYYLDKLEFIIQSFDEKKQTEIYDSHYFQIGKEYFKAKKFKLSIVWAKKTSKPVKYTLRYFKDGLAFLIRKIK